MAAEVLEQKAGNSTSSRYKKQRAADWSELGFALSKLASSTSFSKAIPPKGSTTLPKQCH